MIPVRHSGLCCALALYALTLLSACAHDADRANPIDPTLTPPVELSVATSDTAGAVYLSWMRYDGLAEFSAYHVIRNETRSTEFDTIARIDDVAQTSWTDSTSGTGTGFTYRVDVVHDGGHVSSSDPEAVQALQLPAIRIESLTMDSRTASADLSWSRYRGPRFAAYEVHRTTGNDDVLVREIDAIEDTTFTDTGLLGGIHHVYRVSVRTMQGERAESASVSDGFHEVMREWDLGFEISNVDKDFIRLSTDDDALQALVDREHLGVRLTRYSVDGALLSDTALLERPTSRTYSNYFPRARTTSIAPGPAGERWMTVLTKGGSAQGVIRIDADDDVVREQTQLVLPGVSAIPAASDSGAVVPSFIMWMDGLAVFSESGDELLRSGFQGPPWSENFEDEPWLGWNGANWGRFSVAVDLIGLGGPSPFELRMGASRLLLKLPVADPSSNAGEGGTARLLWIPGDGSDADSTQVPYRAFEPLTTSVRMGIIDGAPKATLGQPAFAHRHTDPIGAFWSSLARIDDRVAHTAGGLAFVIDAAGESEQLTPFDGSVSELRVWQLADESVPRMAACLPEENRVQFGQVAQRIPWRESLRNSIEPRFDPEEISLYYPVSMAAGPDGRMYVLDAGNARIVVFDRDGDFITHFGTPGSGPGQFQFGSDAKIQGGLNFAGSIAVDDGGLIYVADTGNGRIQVFGP